MPGHGGNRTYDLWNTSPLRVFIGYLVNFYLRFNKKKSARVLLFFQNSDEKLLIFFTWPKSQIDV